MKNIKKIIITTPLELSKSFIKKKKFLLTGEWCFENFENQTFKNNIEKIQNPFEDKIIKKKSYLKIISLYKVLIVNLAKNLNRIHKVNYSVNYWEIIIGWWFIQFLTLFYEKYLIVKKIKNSGTLKIFKISEEKKIPINIEQSFMQMNSHLWNNEIFCYLIKNLKKKIVISNIKINGFFVKKNKIKILNFKTYIKQKIINLFSYISTLYRSRDDKIFIINSYLTFFDEIRFQLKVNKVLRFNRSKTYISSFNNSRPRKKLNISIRSKSNLEKLINDIVLNYIPKSYLEDYSKIVKFSKKLPWSRNPKIVFTANNNYSDDVFKIWAAEKKKNFNSKLVYCCHGGGFQTHLFSSDNFFLKRTCDKILVWGKNRFKNKKIKTFLNIKSSSKPFTQKQIVNYDELKILIIQDMPTLYTYCLASGLIHFSEFKTYVDKQKQFLERLDEEVKQKVIIRLGSSIAEISGNGFEDYEKKIWNNGTHKYLLESRNIPTIESINRSYIIIITQISSTLLLECISSNIPFIIFADLKKQVVNPYFKKILLNLKGSQIFFDQPKKISNFLNQTNALKVKQWWKSKKIQKKIKMLQDNFAIYKSNPIIHLAKELKIKNER